MLATSGHQLHDPLFNIHYPFSLPLSCFVGFHFPVKCFKVYSQCFLGNGPEYDRSSSQVVSVSPLTAAQYLPVSPPNIIPSLPGRSSVRVRHSQNTQGRCECYHCLSPSELFGILDTLLHIFKNLQKRAQERSISPETGAEASLLIQACLALLILHYWFYPKLL